MPRPRATKLLVIGNWKMNPLTVDEAKRIIQSTRKASAKLTRAEVVVCPPFPFISMALGKSERMSVGAQDVFTEPQGSYTGEVSAEMLKNMGLKYVIVGHSERRKKGETDQNVADKTKAVLRAGLTAVVCVGEEVRDAQGAYLDTLRAQIKASLEGVQRKHTKQLVLAYEPVWAIGAKEAMTPQLVQEMGIFVRKILSDMYGQSEVMSVPILYGGSVNFRNAKDIIVQGQVQGLLVGRESVNPPGFVELLKAVDQK
ncbi:MAG: triose-phosphate isomerase [Patescibacteria group bacterium]